ncbi:MAG: hypothetical protein JWM87_1181 [Candidatus Eremiobacteraeota bacterium]|nr:hypothetical protein [Candidatus Eremiobacteraeota bacterium]
MRYIELYLPTLMSFVYDAPVPAGAGAYTTSPMPTAYGPIACYPHCGASFSANRWRTAGGNGHANSASALAFSNAAGFDLGGGAHGTVDSVERAFR